MTNSPKNLKLIAPRVPEKSIQAQIVGLLRACGLTVLELGQRRQPIIVNGVKHWQAVTGNTDSTPDLTVSHPDWGNRWIMLECKGQGTRRRPGQVALVEAGQSVFVTSPQEAARAVLSAAPCKNVRLAAWLAQEAK